MMPTEKCLTGYFTAKIGANLLKPRQNGAVGLVRRLRPKLHKLLGDWVENAFE